MLLDLPSPAYLYYTGCCVSASPGARATSDFGVSGTMITNLLSLWKIKEIKVYKVNLPPVSIDVYEYRAARHLQLEEHSMIAVRYPLNLNSAPGGLAHEYKLDHYFPRPLPRLPLDLVPDRLADAIRRHFLGLCDLFDRQPNSPGKMDQQALDHYIRAATPTATFERCIPIVQISKDLTQEEFKGKHAELGYRERLAGPGPQATNAGLLYQLGEDPWTATTETRLSLLPPMIDLYVVIRLH